MKRQRRDIVERYAKWRGREISKQNCSYLLLCIITANVKLASFVCLRLTNACISDFPFCHAKISIDWLVWLSAFSSLQINRFVLVISLHFLFCLTISIEYARSVEIMNDCGTYWKNEQISPVIYNSIWRSLETSIITWVKRVKWVWENLLRNENNTIVDTITIISLKMDFA